LFKQPTAVRICRVFNSTGFHIQDGFLESIISPAVADFKEFNPVILPLLDSEIARYILIWQTRF